MTTSQTFPGLTFEVLDSGRIRLEQEYSGEVDVVEIHPIHLRAMAEAAGMVPTSDPQALEAIQKLARRLQVLRERTSHLATWLATLSDSDHADLSYEQVYSQASADLADEFCADLGAISAQVGGQA